MKGGERRLALSTYHEERCARSGAKRLVFIARHPILEAAHRIAWKQIESGDRRIETLEAAAAARASERDRAENRLRINAAALAHLSHDIRNAMSAVTAVVDMLDLDMKEGRLGVSEPAQLREQLELVKESARRVNRILNSAHALADAEAGVVRVEKERVNVCEEAGHISWHLHPLARKKGITLEVAAGHQAYACVDRCLFGRVLANIIGNAIKFTSEGGVKVSVESANGSVAVKVRDTGIGMRESELGEIFMERRRGEGAERYAGKGLGLYIAKTYTELMGGTIRVESAQGRGSTFIVTFPAAAQTAEANGSV